MDIDRFFYGDIEQVWNKCFLIWQNAGRVNDLPHGIRVTRYLPSFGKRLGYKFAEIYYSQVDFLIQKLSSQNKVEVLCAFEILELVAWEYYSRSISLPKNLLDIKLSIPEPAVSEIKSETFFRNCKFSTIGEFLFILIEHG